MKKSVFSKEQYDSSFIRAQDVDLWIRLLSKNITFFIIPKTLLKYRIHLGESVMQRLNRQSAYAKYGFKIVKKHFPTNFLNIYFWYFALRWSSYYFFYTFTPVIILRFLVKIKDSLRVK